MGYALSLTVAQFFRVASLSPTESLKDCPTESLKDLFIDKFFICALPSGRSSIS
jgi:hypothetical protein